MKLVYLHFWGAGSPTIIVVANYTVTVMLVAAFNHASHQVIMVMVVCNCVIAQLASDYRVFLTHSDFNAVFSTSSSTNTMSMLSCNLKLNSGVFTLQMH